MSVRPAEPEDSAAIRAVHLAAFPSPLEADLVEALERDGDAVVSLVAERGGEVVGHVLLSRMQAAGDGRDYRALGLAPVAVLPGFQGGGVGAALIEAALAIAAATGEQLVFVLGDPDYYTRFGFSVATAAPFVSRYAGPHFMAISFGAPPPGQGTADYSPAFGALG